MYSNGAMPPFSWAARLAGLAEQRRALDAVSNPNERSYNYLQSTIDYRPSSQCSTRGIGPSPSNIDYRYGSHLSAGSMRYPTYEGANFRTPTDYGMPPNTPSASSDLSKLFPDLAMGSPVNNAPSTNFETLSSFNKRRRYSDLCNSPFDTQTPYSYNNINDNRSYSDVGPSPNPSVYGQHHGYRSDMYRTENPATDLKKTSEEYSLNALDKFVERASRSLQPCTPSLDTIRITGNNSNIINDRSTDNNNTTRPNYILNKHPISATRNNFDPFLQVPESAKTQTNTGSAAQVTIPIAAETSQQHCECTNHYPAVGINKDAIEYDAAPPNVEVINETFRSTGCWDHSGHPTAPNKSDYNPTMFDNANRCKLDSAMFGDTNSIKNTGIRSVPTTLGENTKIRPGPIQMGGADCGGVRFPYIDQWEGRSARVDNNVTVQASIVQPLNATVCEECVFRKDGVILLPKSKNSGSKNDCDKCTNWSDTNDHNDIDNASRSTTNNLGCKKYTNSGVVCDSIKNSIPEYGATNLNKRKFDKVINFTETKPLTKTAGDNYHSSIDIEKNITNTLLYNERSCSSIQCLSSSGENVTNLSSTCTNTDSGPKIYSDRSSNTGSGTSHTGSTSTVTDNNNSNSDINNKKLIDSDNISSTNHNTIHNKIVNSNATNVSPSISATLRQGLDATEDCFELYNIHDSNFGYPGLKGDVPRSTIDWPQNPDQDKLESDQQAILETVPRQHEEVDDDLAIVNFFIAHSPDTQQPTSAQPLPSNRNIFHTMMEPVPPNRSVLDVSNAQTKLLPNHDETMTSLSQMEKCLVKTGSRTLNAGVSNSAYMNTSMIWKEDGFCETKPNNATLTTNISSCENLTTTPVKIAVKDANYLRPNVGYYASETAEMHTTTPMTHLSNESARNTPFSTAETYFDSLGGLTQVFTESSTDILAVPSVPSHNDAETFLSDLDAFWPLNEDPLPDIRINDSDLGSGF